MRVNNVYQSFADSVKMYRDKVAIIDDKMKLTYEEINVMSNKVAKFLVEKSIGKENVVAVYMDRSYCAVVTVLGILKAGAAFLPIDMKTPVQRANYMADISKAQYVIRDSKERIDEITLPAIDVHDILMTKTFQMIMFQKI